MSTYNFLTDLGATSSSTSLSTALSNTALLNSYFGETFIPGDTLLIPEGHTFTVMGGIEGNNLVDCTIILNGKLSFSKIVKEWPRYENGHNHAGQVKECISFDSPTNFVLTSTLGGGSHDKLGVLDGNGNEWWWWPFFGYMKFEEDRPRLFRMDKGHNVLIKDILFQDSPYWTTKFSCMDGLEIAGSGITARRTDNDGHGLLDLSAFNTDGFDISGRNVHVHDCNCYAQDDCFTVKDSCTGVSENMLFENNNASGMAMVIGSIGGSTVRNITFRNFVAHHSYKGIYTKFRGGTGKMIDITFENIIMDEPDQFPIWIGPAQQADDPDPCHPNPCSLCWPDIPSAICNPVEESQMENIMLRNIKIRSPKMSLGVVMGSNEMPTRNLTFDNVHVDKCGPPMTTLEETFPLLPLKVWDDYVAKFVALVIAGVVLLVLLCCCLPALLCFKRKWCCWSVWGKANRTRVWAMLALLGFLALVPYFVWYDKVGADKNDRDSYLICSGVEGAVATGNTYPVPQCFLDMTKGTSKWEEGVQACEVGEFWWAFVVGAAGIGGAGWYYYYRVKGKARGNSCSGTDRETEIQLQKMSLVGNAE